MAYPIPDQELEIEAIGDTLVLRPTAPTRLTLDEMFARLDELRAQGATGLSDDALVRPEWPERRSPK